MGLSLKSIGRGFLKLAPITAGFIPGVGPLAAAGIGAATGAIGRGKPKLSNIVGGAAMGAGGSLAKGSLGGADKAGGMMGKLQSVGGFLGKNSDLLLSGAGMIQGARQQGQADKMDKRALDLAERQYAETEGLRSAGRERMLNTQRPDMSGIYAGSSNPFARPLRPLSPSQGATTPAGPQAEDPLERPYREITRLPSIGGRGRFA